MIRPEKELLLAVIQEELNKINQEPTKSEEIMNFIDQNGTTVMSRVVIHLKRVLYLLYKYNGNQSLNPGGVMSGIVNNLEFIQKMLIKDRKFGLVDNAKKRMVFIGDEDEYLVFTLDKNKGSNLISFQRSEAYASSFGTFKPLAYEEYYENPFVELSTSIKFQKSGCFEERETKEKEKGASKWMHKNYKQSQDGKIISWRINDPDNYDEINDSSLQKVNPHTALDLAFPFETPDSTIRYPLIIEQAFPEIYQSAQELYNQNNKKD